MSGPGEKIMNSLRSRKFFNLFRKSFLGNSPDTIALAHLLGGKLLTVKNVGLSWSNPQKNSTSRTYASFSSAWDLYRNHFKIVCYSYHGYHRLDVGTMPPICALCRKFIFACFPRIFPSPRQAVLELQKYRSPFWRRWKSLQATILNPPWGTFVSRERKLEIRIYKTLLLRLETTWRIMGSIL